jgi:hypothetical protein
MSALPYAVKRVKYMTVGLGVFMMLAAGFFIIFLGSYLIGVIFMLTGVFGAVAGSRIKPPPIPPGLSVRGPIIEVRCKSCNGLNFEQAQFCSTCGARL